MTGPARRISIAFQTDKPLAAYGALAAAAEGHGFDGISVYNDLLYQPAWLPLMEVARHTRRAQIGPAAVNPFTCHPIEMAGHIALIDEASRGRAYLGLARGAWLDFLGLAPERVPTALREAFECVRHLLRRSREPYAGKVFSLAGGDSLRWDVARPELPFLLGTRDKWDYFCLLAALSLMGPANYVCYGCRNKFGKQCC
jgi:5,10-methylenetetrahydromethanopterin reductase